eukprot:m.334039 g.334039  ORF g.334039 m.334039 type:complete len:348 (+) comp55661_c0_seq1:694-1737(+)
MVQAVTGPMMMTRTGRTQTTRTPPATRNSNIASAPHLRSKFIPCSFAVVSSENRNKTKQGYANFTHVFQFHTAGHDALVKQRAWKTWPSATFLSASNTALLHLAHTDCLPFGGSTTAVLLEALGARARARGPAAIDEGFMNESGASAIASGIDVGVELSSLAGTAIVCAEDFRDVELSAPRMPTALGFSVISFSSCFFRCRASFHSGIGPDTMVVGLITFPRLVRDEADVWASGTGVAPEAVKFDDVRLMLGGGSLAAGVGTPKSNPSSDARPGTANPYEPDCFLANGGGPGRASRESSRTNEELRLGGVFDPSVDGSSEIVGKAPGITIEAVDPVVVKSVFDFRRA